MAFPVKAIKLLANEAQREEEGFGGAGRVGESVDDADSDEVSISQSFFPPSPIDYNNVAM